MEATPPMTASELHELFCRYCPDEEIAQARVDQADFVERESIGYFEELMRRWRRFGVAPRREEWRP